MVRFVIGILTSLLVGTVVNADDSDPCLSAAAKAAEEVDVPFSVLAALAKTETARGNSGPWPWAINVEGVGAWLSTEAELQAEANAVLSSGRTSFDVGCFQINYRWHGQHFSSLDEMIDPLENARYAAKFIKGLYAESGDWAIAAGAYHSRNPEFASRYRQRFESFYDPDLNPLVRVAQEVTVKPNTFPLLKTGSGGGRLGSLVPMAGG